MTHWGTIDEHARLRASRNDVPALDRRPLACLDGARGRPAWPDALADVPARRAAHRTKLVSRPAVPFGSAGPRRRDLLAELRHDRELSDDRVGWHDLRRRRRAEAPHVRSGISLRDQRGHDTEVVCSDARLRIAVG